jgi:hypothetical protein
VTAGKTADLHYNDFYLGPTDIRLTMLPICSSKVKIPNTICQYSKEFHRNLGQCRIFHGGDTWPLVLNDPAYGDVIFMSLTRKSKASQARRPAHLKDR